MDDNDPADFAPASSNWLSPNLPPPPEAAPALAEVSPAPARSVWDVLALIAGIAGPVLALGSGLVIALRLQRDGASVLLLVSTLMAVGLLGAPLAWYAGRRLRRLPSRNWQGQWRWIAASSALVLGLISLGQASVSLGLLPELSLAIAQPLIFVAAGLALLTIATGRWAGLSPVRVWGHLVSGAWLSVLLSFVAEAALVGGLGAVVLAVLFVFDPGQAREVVSILRTFDSLELEGLLDIALRPWVVVLAFGITTLLIPLIEELLKPIGVILLLGQRPGPMAAFVGGVLGGIGFAVTETLSNLVTLNEPWFVLVLARIGTLAMHGLTAGIVGWGWGQLAARQARRFLGAFAAAIALHGLWNGCVVVIALSGLYITQNPEPGPVQIVLGLLAGAAVLLLIFLVPLSVLGLGWIGYRLRSVQES